ncbi:MAG: glycosyltransferase family 2 protein, partial [Culicoidibacterales bacterium]
AVQTGFRYAVENNYDICVQIDGDGQHIPAEIEKLIQKIESGVDIAIGSRFLKNSDKYEQTLLRKLGAKHISFMIRLFSGLKLTDPTSGMRAYSKDVFVELAQATNERPEPDTMLYFARRRFKIAEVEVEMRERQGGESYLTPLKAVRYMIENTLSFLYVFLRTKKGVK